MKIFIDNTSFLEPYLRGPDEVSEEFLAAGQTVAGANARAAAAQAALRDIRRFRAEITTLMNAKGFARLPRLRNWWFRPIGHCRHLTIGVWRGIFLVAPDESVVVALIFSRAPHNYMRRLRDLIGRHDPKLKRGP